MSNDEYQFPKDEFIDGVEPVAPTAKVGAGVTHVEKTAVKRPKKLIFIAFLGLLVIVGAVMMHNRSAPKPVVSQAPLHDPVLVSQLNTLTQVQAASQNTMTQLQSKVDQLGNQLSATQSANDQLNSSVTTLTSQVKLLAQAVQGINDKLAEKVKPAAVHKKPLPKVKLTYSVTAVVPERAWILSSNGASMSVTIGDPIDQYGNVTAIDADNGHVYTSSGHVINYGLNDY